MHILYIVYLKLNKKNAVKENIEKYIPFMTWLIEIAEEKIVEHRLLKKEFKSHEEFIIFTIIWLRVYKSLYLLAKNKKDIPKKNISYEKFIKTFYKNQEDKYLGMTINAITRESLIPRSTVKRTIENLIKRNLVKRNINRLIIPRSKVRDTMEIYRRYIFQSNKKLYNIFNDLNLESKYHESDSF